MEWLFRGAGLAFFIAWYMLSCKDQKDVVTYRYGTAFVKRSWTLPVLYGVGVYIGLVVAFVGAVMAYMGATGQL